uniref:BTB domain-containing protein n=1 Tax=Hippocampus comes TaxID=109280 RepID=A0A3Q2YXK5_HIPCM
MTFHSLTPERTMEFPWHSGKVLEQFNNQRKQGLLCDCTFVVDGVDFKAHKCVLAACSVYFRTLFLEQKDFNWRPLVQIFSSVGHIQKNGRMQGLIENYSILTYQTH